MFKCERVWSPDPCKLLVCTFIRRSKKYIYIVAYAMSGKTAFVYGTLMAPEVVHALIRRVPPMKPAKLLGYKRHSVKGVVFPAIVPDDGDRASVQGMVGLSNIPVYLACMHAW